MFLIACFVVELSFDFFFFFNDTATTEIYTLSLHDALPIFATLPAVAFVEGSFGTLLLAEDVSVESVRFGHRGEAPILTGSGLGIHVVEERLRRRAVAVRELTAEE